MRKPIFLRLVVKRRPEKNQPKLTGVKNGFGKMIEGRLGVDEPYIFPTPLFKNIDLRNFLFYVSLEEK